MSRFPLAFVLVLALTASLATSACSSEDAPALTDAGRSTDAGLMLSADAGPRACTPACSSGMACADGTCRPAAWSQVTAPMGSFLWGVWGRASNDVWAVGNGGAILHYDGTSWQAVTSPATSSLYDVWGTSASDVWAVGDPTSPSAILHYDGTEWQGVVPYPTNGVLTGIAGSGGDDIWAVGLAFGKGVILHRDRRGWTPITRTETPMMDGLDIDFGFADIWVGSATNAWAAGEAGVYHYDGTTWAPFVPQPTTDLVRAIHASGANDVWVAAEARKTPTRTLFRFDGTAWSSVVYPTDGYISDLWSAGPRDVWAVGEGPSGGIFHYDGTSWTVPPSAAAARGLVAIWAISPADIWAVGQDSVVWHYHI